MYTSVKEPFYYTTNKNN